MTYFTKMQEALRREAAHAYNLTKEDRKTLIDWYVECLEDMGQETDETHEFLNQLGNPSLIYECMQFMPDCLEDLKRSNSL